MIDTPRAQTRDIEKPAQTHEIGSRLAQLRSRAGLSQRALAASADVARAVIVALESGAQRDTGLDNLRALAAALGCPLGALIGADAGAPAPFTVPLSRLAVARENPRLDADDDSIAALADSIRENGLLQPLGVRPARPEEPVDAWIVAGQRRYLALKRYGNTFTPALPKDWPVPCHVLPGGEEGDGSERAIVQGLVENLARRQLSHHDEAAAIAALLDSPAGHTAASIARLIGFTPRHVQMRARLFRELAARARETWANGEISTAQAEALLAADSAEIQCRVLDRILESRLKTEDQVAAQVRLFNENDRVPTAPSPAPVSEPKSADLAEASDKGWKVAIGRTGDRGSAFVANASEAGVVAMLDALCARASAWVGQAALMRKPLSFTLQCGAGFDVTAGVVQRLSWLAGHAQAQEPEVATRPVAALSRLFDTAAVNRVMMPGAVVAMKIVPPGCPETALYGWQGPKELQDRWHEEQRRKPPPEPDPPQAKAPAGTIDNAVFDLHFPGAPGRGAYTLGWSSSGAKRLQDNIRKLVRASGWIQDELLREGAVFEIRFRGYQDR